MGGASLPPGFRFHPTDEELIEYYLKRKVEGLQIELEVIPVINLYKFDPWELPEKSFLPIRDMEWFFFCPRDRKYPNGSRTNRATKAGYWKATGKDRKVVCQSTEVGYRKTLVFYRGRAPLGDRTDWVMHEYRICDDHSQGSPTFKGAFALCRVVKKNKHTRNVGEDTKGKSTEKEISLHNEGFISPQIQKHPMSISSDISCHTSYPNNESQQHASLAISPHFHETMQVSTVDDNKNPVSVESDPSSIWISPSLILDSSKPSQEYHQIQAPACEYFQCDEFPSSSNFNREIEHFLEANYAEFYGNQEFPCGDYDQMNYSGDFLNPY